MRLISVLQQETGLPLFMHYCPASVVDVNTLTKTILELKANGIRTKFAILDSGFYSLSDAPHVQLSFQLSPFYTPANATSFFESFSATDLFRRSSDLQQQSARSALSAAKAKVEQTYDAAAQVRAMQQDIVTYRMNLILLLREYENKQVVLETEQIRFGAGISDASRLWQKELDAMQAASTALSTLRELEYLYVRMQLSGLLSQHPALLTLISIHRFIGKVEGFSQADAFFLVADRIPIGDGDGVDPAFVC